MGDDPLADLLGGPLGMPGAPGAPAGRTRGDGVGTGPVAPDSLFWGVSIQTVDLARLDAYLASVSDQEGALGETDEFSGRLVLRSQRFPERFWLIDCWTDEQALRTATITLRTLSSVAGLTEEPRVINTVQVPVGSATPPELPPVVRQRSLPSAGAGGRPAAGGTLPFYLIAENWIKAVSKPEYLEVQDGFTKEMEGEPGFRCRMLLRDLGEDIHFLVIDEWESEQLAFEAFERRQARLSEATMTRFLGFMAKRGEPDFALGLHRS